MGRCKHTLGRLIAALCPTKRPIGWISNVLLMILAFTVDHGEEMDVATRLIVNGHVDGEERIQ